jgi:hypothetical protein
MSRSIVKKAFLILKIVMLLVTAGTWFGMIFQRQIFKAVYNYLSITKPIKAEVLVIEGWLSDCMLKDAAHELLRGGYAYCIVAGQLDSSSYQVASLNRYGVDSTLIKLCPSKFHRGYSTFNMAASAYQWLKKHESRVTEINVLTGGPHGRKSWTIFKKVFGKNYRIGIISSSAELCDSDLWWSSKKGRRNLIKYGLGYVYALYFNFEGNNQ